MKRYGTPIIVFLVLLAGRAFGQVSYLPEDEEVRGLKHLFLESGRLFPTASFPLARKDLVEFAETLSQTADDPAVRRRVRKYLDELAFEAGAISLGVKGALTYEHYLRTREVWEDFSRLYL